MSLIQTGSSRYTDTDVERGLTALAVAGDNSLKASEAIGISDRTLRDWRQRFADRYLEIRQERAPIIEQTIVQEARALALEAGNVERQALAAVLTSIENGTCKDPASALRNVTTTKSLNIDRIVLPLEGRPSKITINVTAEEALTWLDNQGYVHGTATEEPTPTLEAHAMERQLKRAS